MVGAGKVLVATSDKDGNMISEMPNPIEGHLIEVMTSGLFSYQMMKLSNGVSVLAEIRCALAQFSNTYQQPIYFEL
jgi:hypothetical protein